MHVFEFFEHTADVGLRMRAGSFADLLVEAGRALVATMVAHPERIQAHERVTIQLDGSNRDYLLIDWLNELLYLFEHRGLICCRFVVNLGESGLTAEVAGEPFDASRHGSAHEVKAITYHGLRVAQQGDQWSAEVVIDI